MRTVPLAATVGGKMYHGRILDYLKGIGLEQNAVVMVFQPDQGHAWVNVGYAGFIGSVTCPDFCATCNKVRLTADGKLKPCLFSDREIAVDFSDIRASLMQAAAAKPARGSVCANRGNWQIGG